MHFVVENPKAKVLGKVRLSVKAIRDVILSKFPRFFGGNDHISFAAWEPLSAVVRAEYVTDNDDGLIVDTTTLPITKACEGHVGSLESLRLIDDCPMQGGIYPEYGQNLENYFNWSSVNSVITITGDFHISFWWQRSAALNPNGIQCFVGHINQSHYIDVTGEGELNDRIRIRVAGLTPVDINNALAGIPNGEFVFIEWLRTGDVMEVKVNNVSKGTASGQTGSLLLTGGANRGGDQPLAGFWGHLRITDVTGGTYWEYLNRDESGSDLLDTGPNGNHAMHYDETFGPKDVDADRSLIPNVERNFTFNTKSIEFSGDSTGSVVFNNMTDENWTTN